MASKRHTSDARALHTCNYKGFDCCTSTVYKLRLAPLLFAVFRPRLLFLLLLLLLRLAHIRPQNKIATCIEITRESIYNI